MDFSEFDEQVEEEKNSFTHGPLFSSPIQQIHLSDSRKDSHGRSIDNIIEFSGSYRKIIEKENEDEENGSSNVLFDLLGNPICEFK